MGAVGLVVGRHLFGALGILNKKLLEVDERLGKYSRTRAGQVNYVLSEFFTGMHSIVDEFRHYIMKRYALVNEVGKTYGNIDESAQ